MIDRRVAGMVLMVLGSVAACYWGIEKPAGLVGQLGAFALCFALFAGGLWLWVWKGRR
jgi:hypothetical protein